VKLAAGVWMISYHDLYITTKDISRTRLFNLPFSLMVICTRAGGWELWDMRGGFESSELLAGEYAGADKWLVLEENEHVILDSRKNND
jgi:hypothetical protein